MLAMPSQIDIYEDMSALSARMVARLRNALRGKDDNTALDPGEAERKRSLIQSILDNDAEIRRHTEPWMEHVRQFLGNQASRKRVERAYGAGR